jgi:hypothetical protein
MKMDGCGQATSERRWTEAIRTTRFSEEPTAAAKSPNEPAKGARRLGSLLTMLDLDAPSSSYVPISATGKPPVAAKR